MLRKNERKQGSEDGRNRETKGGIEREMEEGREEGRKEGKKEKGSGHFERAPKPAQNTLSSQG